MPAKKENYISLQFKYATQLKLFDKLKLNTVAERGKLFKVIGFLIIDT